MPDNPVLEYTFQPYVDMNHKKTFLFDLFFYKAPSHSKAQQDKQDAQKCSNSIRGTGKKTKVIIGLDKQGKPPRHHPKHIISDINDERGSVPIISWITSF